MDAVFLLLSPYSKAFIMVFLIRTADVADSDLFPDIERSSGKIFLTIPDLAWIADDDVTSSEDHCRYIRQGTVWVAETSQGEVAGFLTAEVAGNELHIWLLAVEYAFQRKGLGRRLVSTAVAYAENNRLNAVTLTTFRDVVWNEPFYAALGFKTLAISAITPRLSEALEREIRHGMPGKKRCAMQRNCATISASS